MGKNKNKKVSTSSNGTTELPPSAKDAISLVNRPTSTPSEEFRKQNPDKAKNSELKRSFGITLPIYEKMLEDQGHVCAICKGKETALHKDGGPRRMPVDHCHDTGKVRGLLCTACNRALGLFKDDIGVLESALEYLRKHK